MNFTFNDNRRGEFHTPVIHVIVWIGGLAGAAEAVAGLIASL